jgi:hypothetical protein
MPQRRNREQAFARAGVIADGRAQAQPRQNHGRNRCGAPHEGWRHATARRPCNVDLIDDARIVGRTPSWLSYIVQPDVARHEASRRRWGLCDVGQFAH